MLKEMLLRTWDKIVVWLVIGLIVVVVIAIFLAGGNPDDNEFKQNLERIRQERERNRGGQDVVEQHGQDLRDVLEEQHRRREELERQVDESGSEDARQALQDFLDKYGD